MASDAARRLAEIDRLAARALLLIAAHRGQDLSMIPAPDKVAALVDSVRLLTALGAPHALIGGIAVGIHSGESRATLDTDLAVDSTIARSLVVGSFTAAGFDLVGEFAHSVNFRHPRGEPVQLAFDPGFDPMIARAERFTLGAVEVPIVTRADLLAMKERAAADPARRRSKRLRDEADIELLRGDAPDPDEGW